LAAHYGGDRHSPPCRRQARLDFHFPQKIDGVSLPVRFRCDFLTAEAFHFGHGHAFNPELGEGFLDLLELNGLMIASIFFMSSNRACFTRS